MRVLTVLLTLLCAVYAQTDLNHNYYGMPILYVSTLDGNFYALDRQTGEVRWKIKEAKVVDVPQDFQKDQKFFPDPIDGSLYVVNRGSMEKLVHTIPEMVNNSPMRTRNGLMYTGKKTDYWISLNPESGDKQETTTEDGVQISLAVATEDQLYVGKTEYSLTIMDSKTRQQTWNITYVSYSAPLVADVLYTLTHYCSSSDGTIITFHTNTNQMLWHNTLSSPVISIFIENYGGLLRVPFRTLASDTMTGYVLKDIKYLITDHQKNVVSCLFIGKYAGGIYAMNEMMHAHDPEQPRRHLIGPSEPREDTSPVQTFGHHPLPMIPDHLMIANQIPSEPVPSGGQAALPPADPPTFLDTLTVSHVAIVATVIILVLSTAFVAGLCTLYRMTAAMRDSMDSIQRGSKSSYKGAPRSKHTYSCGKITVYMGDIIGHGSEGTVVFKGMFEKRDVAVKRVLLDFIDIDLHEVELLRQADEHPNVIRYYCMETDSMFRYLALELCQASLRDYVENTVFPKTAEQNKRLLLETISGLRHLHTLKIVHRDIKPGNILITKCPKTKLLKALISDFGLCRKISEGRQSLTARTGSAGTDGWIAPEMLCQAKKISCAVDIFSYGCILYYVLSGGQHPFGNDVYRRQANIQNADYDLSALSELTQDNVLAVALVCETVKKPIERPTAESVHMHPYFWTPANQLRFFMDVSDRVEKEENSELCLSWEHNAVGPVLRGGWMHRCPDLEQDLYKYRKYKTTSVRDLLRAMRNKRHHYRELPEDLRATLGDIPDGYMNYFTSRFPRLLLHTYLVMLTCANECVFRQYYPEVRTFADQRQEMARSTPEPSSLTPAPPDTERRSSQLALNTTGEYTSDEYIPAVPYKQEYEDPRGPTSRQPPNKDNRQHKNKNIYEPPKPAHSKPRNNSESEADVSNWRKKNKSPVRNKSPAPKKKNEEPHTAQYSPHTTSKHQPQPKKKNDNFNPKGHYPKKGAALKPPPGFDVEPVKINNGSIPWFVLDEAEPSTEEEEE